MPSAAGAAAINLGGQLFGRAFARKDRIREKQYNLKLDKYTRAQNLEQWNRQNIYDKKLWDEQNLYNSPGEQMQRLKDAGLNPNLVYGTGAATGQTSPIQREGISPYQSTRTDSNQSIPNIQGVIGTYQDMRMKNAQIDNLEAQNTNIKRISFGQALKNAILGTQGEKAGIDLGQTKGYEDSPYFQQSQSAVKKAKADAAMRQLELSWWQSLKGIQGATGIMRILKMFIR